MRGATKDWRAKDGLLMKDWLKDALDAMEGVPMSCGVRATTPAPAPGRGGGWGQDARGGEEGELLTPGCRWSFC